MIDAGELRTAARALDELDDIAAAELEVTERKLGEAIAAKVRIRARRHRRTGRMERYITVKAEGRGLATRVTVHAGGSVAHLIAGGVRPHTIRPLRSQALAIRRGGAVRGFAEVVKHRGVRPDPFFADGVEDAGHEIDQLTAQAADAIAGELATSITRRR